MTLELNNKSWRDWKIVLVLFILLIGALLSDEDNNKDEVNANLNKYTVVRVIDGDTIELASGEKVRYIGIDTPESVDPRKPVECFARQASLRNKELVLGKVVSLEEDIGNKDRYDRLLRYVYVGDKFINLQLVSEGYAYSVAYPPNVENQELFDVAEQMARERGEGLWSACQQE